MIVSHSKRNLNTPTKRDPELNPACVHCMPILLVQIDGANENRPLISPAHCALHMTTHQYCIVKGCHAMLPSSVNVAITVHQGLNQPSKLVFSAAFNNGYDVTRFRGLRITRDYQSTNSYNK